MKTIKKKEPYLKLLDITGNIYEEFRPDQVLTHNNLNKLVDYFEDQDRLTRTHLSGVGIGCGLKILSYSNSKIKISKGFGITTDGDLVKSSESEFLYYTALSDNGKYPLFEGKKVFELHTTESAASLTDEIPLADLKAQEGIFPVDCMLIAYVESFTEDEGLCGGFGCDDTGNKVYANLKFLITHKDNYGDFIAKDTIYKNHDVLTYYDDLPDLCVTRLILKHENTQSAIDIHNQFQDGWLFNDLAKELKNAIVTILNKLEHRIDLKSLGIYEEEIKKLFVDIFEATESDFDFEIQYKYDLLKDLLDTYQHIRDLLLDINFECVPNVSAFPKHLLLGTLVEATREATRHQFYPSPIITGNNENLTTIKTLAVKFFALLKEYYVPDMDATAIKITPSRDYTFPLTERTIPYYYLTEELLVSHWSTFKNRLRKTGNQLAYHIKNLKDSPCVQKPLAYDHLDKEFYRIEGHLGKDHISALKEIQKQKADYNLAFDVKTVSIGNPIKIEDLDEVKCSTKNYEILLQAWEKEFNCIAKSAEAFFKQYKYTDTGDNYTAVYEHADRFKTASNAASMTMAMEDLKKRKTIARAKAIVEGKESIENKFLAEYEVYEGAPKTDSLEFAIQYAYEYAGVNNVPGYVEAIALAYIKDNTDSDISDEEAYFYIENPIKIITNLQSVRDLYHVDVSSLYETDKTLAFDAAITKLCTDSKQALLALSNLKAGSSFGTRAHDKMYEFYVYEVSKICCLKEKINWVKEQLDEIRNNAYKDLILSELVVKHPGIEHMAGVPKGGTFLMVYLGEPTKDEKIERISSEFDSRILFDFALPYMCCSDCPPETIVFQPEVTVLPDAKLDPRIFCIQGDAAPDPVIFTDIQPEGAVITCPQAPDAVFLNDAEQTVFDPMVIAMDEALVGQTISFLVNEKIPQSNTDAIVYRIPQAITLTEGVHDWLDNEVETKVSVNINSSIADAFANVSYLKMVWTDESGTEIGEGEKLEDFSITVSLDENELTRTFTLTISADNNAISPDDERFANCIISDEIEITTSRPPEIVPDLTVPQETFCLPVGDRVRFFITDVEPSGATISSRVNGLVENIDNENIAILEKTYRLHPNVIPNRFLGVPIGFDMTIGNSIVIPASNPEITAYRLPVQADVNITVTIGEWVTEGLEVELIIEDADSSLVGLDSLVNKSYLTYTWFRADGVTPLTITGVENRFIIPETGIGRSIDEELRLQVSTIDGVDICPDGDFILTEPVQDEEETVDDTPPDLSIPRTVFCLPKDGGAERFGDIQPANAVVTCPDVPAAVEQIIIRGVVTGYRFNPEAVPNNMLGEELSFELLVDGNVEIPQSDPKVFVYRLPKKDVAAIVMKDEAQWTDTTIKIDLEVDFNTDTANTLTHQDYMIYEWENADGKWQDTSRNTNGIITFEASTDGEKTYLDTINLTIKVDDDNAGCVETFTFDINETETVALGCETPFKARVLTFKLNETLAQVKAAIRGRSFAPGYNADINDPISNLLTFLDDPNTDISEKNSLSNSFEQINAIRRRLFDDFLNNPRIERGFEIEFLRVDEALEIIGLELLRCIDVSLAGEIANETMPFFSRSGDISTLRSSKPEFSRALINTSYATNYNPVTDIKTAFDNKINI